MPAQAPILEPQAQFAADVRAGLSKTPQKELPSSYLYDNIGSALFEAITLLPEYGLTRADARLLQRYAPDIVRHLPGRLTVVELGSGSGAKTRWILEALAQRHPAVYYPIDISRAALARCIGELEDLRGVDIVPLARPYLSGMAEIASRRKPDERLLVLFLGSTIGNFEDGEAVRFLGEVRNQLVAGDALLLGTDLEKPVPQLLLAYDDPTGVTAAFNLNLLARINRELDGDFELRSFVHQARYNGNQRRIEMHLGAKRRQTVSIRGADFTFSIEEGETIWTEACHKYRPSDLARMARRCGFTPGAQWVDDEWPFAENLWLA
jgi:dimethylhistidine N-methyltransferase